ncbi:hypothetical protein SDC9_197875 [bioreactor metagenome]|uniref:Uncharacterized protein n=1 Tax=bioreactor metagenome TaxID=1076179 RepID=A0A645IID8_9ZZZZ
MLFPVFVAPSVIPAIAVAYKPDFHQVFSFPVIKITVVHFPVIPFMDDLFHLTGIGGIFYQSLVVGTAPIGHAPEAA